MTDSGPSRQLDGGSSSETEETITVASYPPADTTARSTRSASKRPARQPSPPPPPPPELTTSTPALNRHIQSSNNSVPPNYKLSSIPKLVGTENYSSWRDISQYVLEPFNSWDIVLGEEAMDTFEGDVPDNFIHHYQYAATYFIQTVESQWLILLATHKTPSKIWTALEDKFARENTFSFFDQLNSVFDNKYDTLDLLSYHINK